jgi:SAM-dependent methyltransferase
MAETHETDVEETSEACEICGGQMRTTPLTQQFYRCGKCGFMLRRADRYRPADESYLEVAELRGGGKQMNRLRLLMTGRTLERHLKRFLAPSEHLRICEIGFAEGFLISKFARRGDIIWGIELDKHYYASVLQKLADFENVALCCGRLEDTDLPPGFFDLVYAVHVVEHLTELRSTMEKLARSIRVGGCLFLETPNGDEQREMRLFKDRWYHFGDPTHREIFSSRAMEILLQSCGFEVIRIDKPIVQSVTFEACSVLRYLNADFRNPLVRLLMLPLLSLFLFPARLVLLPHDRPNMQIVARWNGERCQLGSQL